MNTGIEYATSVEYAQVKRREADMTTDYIIWTLVFLIAVFIFFRWCYGFWFRHRINRTIIANAEVYQYLVKADDKGLLPVHVSQVIQPDMRTFMEHYNRHANTKSLPAMLQNLTATHAPQNHAISTTNNNSDDDVEIRDSQMPDLSALSIGSGSQERAISDLSTKPTK